ncbi:MAG: RluA family pseudouridine synthase, partial [Andreesenia angusta]|nr:RluA family pseudouridine synthase [Andreesenia angusta]
KDFTLVSLKLETGRTHQIRAQLSHKRYPILGDRKYGNREINKLMNKKYGLKNQLLHAYKIVLNGLDGDLNYLNGKVFMAEADNIFSKIEEDLFK